MKETDHTPTEHLVSLRIDRFRLQLPAIVERVLAEVPFADLRQLVKELAMEPNEVLFKRKERPQVVAAYTVRLIGQVLGLEGDRLDDLCTMSVAFVEAGDIHDDAVDGDYADGHLHHLLAVSSTLHFVATRCALRLGPEVADAWIEGMYELPHSLLLEKDGDGSLATYLEAVQAQAALFGAVGRAAAIAAGSPPEVRDAVVELTKMLYAYLQYPQDLREAPVEVGSSGSTLAANIMRHMDVARLRVLFGQVHARMQTALARLPNTRHTTHLRELIDSMRPA
jgi:hypothetical protein